MGIRISTFRMVLPRAVQGLTSRRKFESAATNYHQRDVISRKNISVIGNAAYISDNTRSLWFCMYRRHLGKQRDKCVLFYESWRVMQSRRSLPLFRSTAMSPCSGHKWILGHHIVWSRCGCWCFHLQVINRLLSDSTMYFLRCSWCTIIGLHDFRVWQSCSRHSGGNGRGRSSLKNSMTQTGRHLNISLSLSAIVHGRHLRIIIRLVERYIALISISVF